MPFTCSSYLQSAFVCCLCTLLLGFVRELLFDGQVLGALACRNMLAVSAVGHAEAGLVLQFERTLIVAEDDAYVSYLEGCTAPSYDKNQVRQLAYRLQGQLVTPVSVTAAAAKSASNTVPVLSSAYFIGAQDLASCQAVLWRAERAVGAVQWKCCSAGLSAGCQFAGFALPSIKHALLSTAHVEHTEDLYRAQSSMHGSAQPCGACSNACVQSGSSMWWLSTSLLQPSACPRCTSTAVISMLTKHAGAAECCSSGAGSVEASRAAVVGPDGMHSPWLAVQLHALLSLTCLVRPAVLHRITHTVQYCAEHSCVLVQLHAAVVELAAGANAEIKYSTVQNWYAGNEQGVGGIYNFVTKRGLCRGDHSHISWTQVSWRQ